MSTVNHQELIDQLFNLHQTNGFISEDDALDAMIASKLSLNEIDIVSEKLLSLGVIIRTDLPNTDCDDDEYDRSKISYEALFDDVVSIDPGLANFINTIRSIQPPQHREWRNLMPQAKNGNQYAYNRLFEMYLKIVVKISMSFHKRYNLPLADTIQEGCIGLISALDKFELGKQDLFTTYAPWWIRQAIQRSMVFTPFPILQFPAHFQEKLYTIYDLVKEHCCENCKKSITCENLIFAVSEKLECDSNTAYMHLRFYRNYLSIERATEECSELFSDSNFFVDAMDETINSNQLACYLNQIIKSLSDKEQRVLSLRYGLINGQSMTLEEVGNIMGVTRERIRQIESKAFRKLHRPAKLKYNC